MPCWKIALTSLNEEGKTHLNRIRAATQRMGMLIDDLLNLSRLSRAEMHTQSVDISAIACSVAEDLRKSQPERQIELRIEDGLKTTADPRTFEGRDRKPAGQRLEVHLEAQHPRISSLE